MRNSAYIKSLTLQLKATELLYIFIKDWRKAMKL